VRPAFYKSEKIFETLVSQGSKCVVVVNLEPFKNSYIYSNHVWKSPYVAGSAG
jgi:hypothetical protein